MKKCKSTVPYFPGVAGHKHPCEIWVKRGGSSKNSNSGPVGRSKTRFIYTFMKKNLAEARAKCWDSGKPYMVGTCAKRWKENKT